MLMYGVISLAVARCDQYCRMWRRGEKKLGCQDYEILHRPVTFSSALHVQSECGTVAMGDGGQGR